MLKSSGSKNNNNKPKQNNKERQSKNQTPKPKPTTNLDIFNLGWVVVIFLLKELIVSIFSLLVQSGSISPPVLLWEIQLLSCRCRVNVYLDTELYLASWKASRKGMDQACWLNNLEAAETWKWNRWQKLRRTPCLLSPAGPAGVDRHIKLGVGKLSAFPFLTFGRKGISGTVYLLCLNVISDEKLHQILFSNVSYKAKEKTEQAPVFNWS